MNTNMDINSTHLGRPLRIKGDIDVSNFHREMLSEEERKGRVLKYTVVTAHVGEYKTVWHEILNLARLSNLEGEINGDLYEERPPFGNLVKKNQEKQFFIYNISQKNEKFCNIAKRYADEFILGIKECIDLYKSNLNNVIGKPGQEKAIDDLLNECDHKRDEHINILDERKIMLKRDLERHKHPKEDAYKFLIDGLEYFFSDGILMGKGALCQIPIRQEENSEVSDLQARLSFKENKVIYEDLGPNIATPLRDITITGAKAFKHYINSERNVIDAGYEGHQLLIFPFGKKIPLIKGLGEDEAAFNKRVIDDFHKNTDLAPQYYLALELAGR